MAVTAFVARSFDPNDEARVRPILSFLETFRKAGFLCEEAEAAEVESVSAKVRKMIDEKDAFVGLFTRKHAIYNLPSTFAAGVSLAFGKLRPQKWSAPAWVLQESGYAISAQKKLILLREDGVEIPGLQGDLEYVSFDPSNPLAVFPKLSEMINDLLARAAGREVRVEVAERLEQAEAKPEPPAARQEQKPTSTDEGPDEILNRFIEMMDAADKRDLGAVYEAWKAGSGLIDEGKGGTADKVSWDAWYFRARYDAGDPEGLEALRRMRRENPARRDPVIAIAYLLKHAKEHEEAAKMFLEAAALPENTERTGDLLGAARELAELKRHADAIALLEKILAEATDDTKRDAISLLYDVLKDSGETFFAFATAEAALHDNPQLYLRFELGLDYRRHGLKELALHHFKVLHRRNSSDAGSLHNLSLLYADCELPIMSVRHYKQSFKLGETISAANLGYMYLDAGMAAEAAALVKEAMALEPHDSRVESCLADTAQRPQEELEKESELLVGAAAEKDFFVSMGTALRSALPAVDGRWEFPFGEMALLRDGGKLSGSAEVKKDESALSALLFAGSTEAKTRKRIDRYALDGVLKGAVCKFKMTVREDTENPYHYAARTLGDLDDSGSRSGFIVFANDGRSGTYVEIKEDKLGERRPIRKVS